MDQQRLDQWAQSVEQILAVHGCPCDIVAGEFLGQYGRLCIVVEFSDDTPLPQIRQEQITRAQEIYSLGWAFLEAEERRKEAERARWEKEKAEWPDSIFVGG